jgi:hypothetical protein
MSEFRALDTRYRGFRFRSRLEARWAVAFDAMKQDGRIEYEYEPQGFLIDGVPYLPDFHLRGIGFFEVKGMASGVPTTLYQSFANQINANLFVAVGGIPDPNLTGGYLRAFIPEQNIDAVMGRLHPEIPCVFLMCGQCSHIGIFPEHDCDADLWCECTEGQRQGVIHRHFPRWFEAARGARFEHGECG